MIKMILLMLIIMMGSSVTYASFKMEIGLEAARGGSLSNDSIRFRNGQGGSAQPPLEEGCYGELGKNYVVYIYTDEYIDYTLFENGAKIDHTRRFHDQTYDDYMDINGYRYILVGDALLVEEKDDVRYVYVTFCKTKL